MVAPALVPTTTAGLVALAVSVCVFAGLWWAVPTLLRRDRERVHGPADG